MTRLHQIGATTIYNFIYDYQCLLYKRNAHVFAYSRINKFQAKIIKIYLFLIISFTRSWCPCSSYNLWKIDWVEKRYVSPPINLRGILYYIFFMLALLRNLFPHHLWSLFQSSTHILQITIYQVIIMFSIFTILGGFYNMPLFLYIFRR